MTLPNLARLAMALALSTVVSVAPSVAVAASPALVVPAQEFKDLPGVSSAPRQDKTAYDCHTVLRKTDKWGEIDYLGDSGMPQIGYRCERDGFVYEGSRPPSTGQWIPGINPHHLPD